MDEFLQDIVDCFNKETSMYADTPKEVLEKLDKAIEKDALNSIYYPDK